MPPDRVIVDPARMAGAPTIRDTRVTVKAVLGQLAARRTVDEVPRDNPHLEREDVLAAPPSAESIQRELPFVAVCSCWSTPIRRQRRRHDPGNRWVTTPSLVLFRSVDGLTPTEQAALLVANLPDRRGGAQDRGRRLDLAVSLAKKAQGWSCGQQPQCNSASVDFARVGARAAWAL